MRFIDLKTQYERLKPVIDGRIHAVLEHGQYIMGPEVEELERELARFVGVRHCLGVASGTDALLIAMLALDIGPGAEVITTPFTFMATAEIIALLGATPVFVDVEPLTYNLDAGQLAAAITPATRLIVPVSLYGQCADMDAINEIAVRHRLPVLEDAAQSLGATYRGRRSGGLTTVATTSFYPAKPLGCYGDGGACFTDDDMLAGRMRQIRDHGQDGRYHHVRLGLNGRLDTLQAAVLLAKLEVFADELASRNRIARRYDTLLAQAGTVQPPYVALHNTSVYAQYTVRVSERAAVQSALEARGVPTATHYPLPLHLQPVFAAAGQGRGSFPAAEQAAGEVLSLPLHPYLSTADQDEVVAALHEAVGSGIRAQGGHDV